MAPSWWEEVLGRQARYQELNSTEMPDQVFEEMPGKMPRRTRFWEKPTFPSSVAQFFLFGILALLAMYGLVSLTAPPPARIRMEPSLFHGIADPDIPVVLQKLFQHRIPALDAKSWENMDGDVFEVDSDKPFRYTTPLKKQVLILDVDTRAGKKRPSDIGYDGRMKWTNVARLSAGYMNHYMYSLLHGYDYQMVIPEDVDEDLHATWAKVPAMAAKIKDYKFVVFMDADALMTNLELPLEWLMNYWGVGPNKALTLAKDPGGPINKDSHNKNNLNTGFVIVQQTPMVDEIMQAWLTCTDDTVYTNCSQYKKEWPHEQAVMSSFIRYDYRPYIKQLPCREANGSPAFGGKCDGLLVGHWWAGKGQVPEVVGNQMAQAIAERVHAHYIEEDPVHHEKL